MNGELIKIMQPDVEESPPAFQANLMWNLQININMKCALEISVICKVQRYLMTLKWRAAMIDVGE